MHLKHILIFVLFSLAILVVMALALPKFLQEAEEELPFPTRYPTSVTALKTSVELALSPGYGQRALPEQTVVYTHVLTNVGSVTDTFLLEVDSRLTWPAMLRIAGQAPTHLGPIQLAPDITATVALSLAVPKHVLSGTVEHTTITATSMISHTVKASVVDMTHVYRVPGLDVSAGTVRNAIANSTVSFLHTLTNTGAITDIFTIEASSLRGWTVTLLSDVMPPQTTIQLPVRLRELEKIDFWARVNIPADVSLGSKDKISVTITSLLDENITQTVTDVIVVGEPTLIYLPLLQKDARRAPPYAKLGVDFADLITSAGVISYDLPMSRDMGAGWVRVLVSWIDIETSPGVYDWDAYDPVFTRLEDLGFKGLVVTYGAPAWAAEESCGPLSDTLALENFLGALVPRYADVVGAWEFVNEPDGAVPHEYGPIIGCWGLYPDAYARSLAIFAAKVRALDPSALVLFGGLAYDAWAEGLFVRDFFEKALQSGASTSFDVVGVHYYPISPDIFPTLASKVEDVQAVMARNNVSGKRVWVTETGMWVNEIGDPRLDGSLELQRDFIVRELTRGFAVGVDNMIWFDPREYPAPASAVQRWLIDEKHQPLNAYFTFQHFAKQLEDLYCTGAYLEVPTGIEAYKYEGMERFLYVLWSNTGSQAVTLPASSAAALMDRDGAQSVTLPVTDGRVTFEVGAVPIFVDISRVP